jgi:hypothetical protein
MLGFTVICKKIPKEHSCGFNTNNLVNVVDLGFCYFDMRNFAFYLRKLARNFQPVEQPVLRHKNLRTRLKTILEENKYCVNEYPQAEIKQLVLWKQSEMEFLNGTFTRGINLSILDWSFCLASTLIFSFYEMLFTKKVWLSILIFPFYWTLFTERLEFS